MVILCLVVEVVEYSLMMFSAEQQNRSSSPVPTVDWEYTIVATQKMLLLDAQVSCSIIEHITLCVPSKRGRAYNA